MNNVPLYFAIGVPVLAIIMNAIGSSIQINPINVRLKSMDANINARFTSIENRFTSLEARFDTLTGKVIDIYNRLTRVQTLRERH